MVINSRCACWPCGLLALMVVLGCGSGSPAEDAFTINSAKPAGPLKIAELSDALAAIDLRKLTVPADDKHAVSEPTYVRFEATGEVVALTNDCLAQLRTLGCQPITSAAPIMTPTFTQVVVTKGDYRIILSGMNGSTPGKASVTVENQGNLDTRGLPQPADAGPVYGSPASTMLFTAETVPATTEFITQALVKAGWQLYEPMNQAVANNEEQQFRLFRQRAVGLSVSIGVAPAQQNKTSIQYTSNLLPHEWPAPPEAIELELDVRGMILTCKTTVELSAVSSFYREAIPKLGYDDKPGNSKSANDETLVFHAPDESALMVILHAADGTTTVKLEGISARIIRAMRKSDEERKAEAAKKSE